jgi:membrane protein YqaA with SNARE-associated domain
MVFGETFVIWAKNLIVQFSYLAIFFTSMAGTSTIFIPFPIDLIISVASGPFKLHPFLVGIFAGMGAAAGELTGYLVGVGSRYVIEEKKGKISRIKILKKKLLKKFRVFRKMGFLVILLASFFPFPFDIVGILSGASNYDLKKFYIAVLLGKVGRCLIIAYASYYTIVGIEWFVREVP